MPASGVLINAVTPGPVASELWLEPGGLVDQTVAAQGGTRREVLDAAAAGLPIRRLAGPEEIAAVIVFLCSDLASDCRRRRLVGRRRRGAGHHLSCLRDSGVMAVNTDAIGKTYPATVYAVGREKIREYASAVGEHNPIHLDPDAARSVGFADVVAPPMFAVVYSNAAILPGLFDPDLGIDFAHMVHGSQEFRWGPLVIAGDEITTTATVKDVSERGGMDFYVFQTDSRNQNGDIVCVGTWTNIVRAGGS